ncbi:MAG: RagB/SusD family nutrient uptake outer membrane protein, partial [Sphingobacterium sp.]
MKRIYRTAIIGLAFTILFGCEKALEKTPDSQTTIDKVLSNFEATKSLRDVVYGQIYQARDQISFVMNTIESLTDNAFWPSTYNAYEWHNGSLSLSNPVIDWDWSSPKDQLWPDFWRGIRLANNAIKYLPQSTAKELTEKQRALWVAEARVLRCWYYMNLLEFYGPVP